MRKWLVVFAGAITGAGGLAAIPARAAPGSDYEVTYFADRQMTKEAGQFYKPCGNGAARMRGKRTRYFVKSQSKCPGAGGIPSGSFSCNFTKAGCTDAVVTRFLPLIGPPRN
ncbi:hypothetical protein ABZT49_22540 [Methylobacterium sp. EM32]|uniref:hypothetical protein n=1 Tax=Methylobacterium sp. EM32 TaxID=3163481 RepID=UPI0033BBABF3